MDMNTENICQRSFELCPLLAESELSFGPTFLLILCSFLYFLELVAIFTHLHDSIFLFVKTKEQKKHSNLSVIRFNNIIRGKQFCVPNTWKVFCFSLQEAIKAQFQLLKSSQNKMKKILSSLKMWIQLFDWARSQYPVCCVA